MASRLGVDEKDKPALEEIKKEVAPVSVLRSIDEAGDKGCDSDATVKEHPGRIGDQRDPGTGTRAS